MKTLETITSQQLTHLLEEQQRQAVLAWVADPFGNLVKAFHVSLPGACQIEYQGQLRPWSADKPFPVCLRVHEEKVAKSAPTRAAKLPDGGLVRANGNWTWGAGNAPAPTAAG